MTSSEPTLDHDTIFAACASGIVTGAKRRQFIDGLSLTDLPSRANALLIWLTDFLLRECPNHQPGVWLWAKALKSKAVETIVAAICNDTNSPAPVVAISGGRYVAVNWLRPYDLDEGAFIDFIPIDIFETRVFNLRVLYRSCIERQKKHGPRSRPGLA